MSVLARGGALLRLRSRTPAAFLVARTLATSSLETAPPTTQAELETYLEKAIAEAKAYLEGGPKGEKIIYSVEEQKVDQAAGLVNISKIASLFGDEPELKQKMVAEATKFNTLNKLLKDSEARVVAADVDWGALITKAAKMGLGDDYLAAEQAKYEKELANMEAKAKKDVSEATAKMEAEWSKAEATMMKAVVEMQHEEVKSKIHYFESLKQLFVEAKNIDNITVADLLEKNPEWRIAIEEDIKNHNWAPNAPESIKAQIESGKMNNPFVGNAAPAVSA
jgi:hypothetical protein